MRQSRSLVVLHEASHVVARHLVGLLGFVDDIEIPWSGDAGGHAVARVNSTRTGFEACRSRADVEAEIVAALAGCASLRELGLDDRGGADDERLAGTLALHFCGDDIDAAVQLYDSASLRCERLVADPRFQDLLTRLAVELQGVSSMSGVRAAELLRSWDPLSLSIGHLRPAS